MQIENNVFLVTGGGSGLGAATAAMLVQGGAKVVIADINQEAGAALATRLGSNARFVATDVCSEASAMEAVDTALKVFGGLHGLISCAGVAPAKRVIGKEGPHGLEDFTRVIQINLIGTFNMMRLAADAMSKGQPKADGERGVIINTASVAAFDGQIGQAAYASSKGGVVALVLPAAREFAQFGIRVNAIAPGIFDTPMLQGLSEPARESLAASLPFPKKLGDPAQFAALARHMIENRYLNGEVVRLDASLRMAPK